MLIAILLIALSLALLGHVYLLAADSVRREHESNAFQHLFGAEQSDQNRVVRRTLSTPRVRR